MSRGPGRWQRVLIDLLDTHEAFSVADAVRATTSNPTRSDLVAARRAARSLVEAGKARAVYVYLPTADGARQTPQLVLTGTESSLQSNAASSNGCPSWVEPAPAELGKVRMSVRAAAAITGESPSTISRIMQLSRG